MTFENEVKEMAREVFSQWLQVRLRLFRGIDAHSQRPLRTPETKTEILPTEEVTRQQDQ
jgi:hypothetical protein